MSDGMNRNVFLHQSVAEEYDKFYKSATGELIDRIEKEMILQHLNSVSGNHLLELGCGTGHWSDFFTKAGFFVTGIDSSDAMLEVAKRKEIPNVDFQKADAGKLPFSDNSFQTVVSITMLEFVEDIEGVIDEADRVLAPGGTLIVGCLNALSEVGKNKDNDPVFMHGRFFTPEAVKNMLSRFGSPTLSEGVYLSQDYQLLDKTSLQNTVQPVFIAASVKKIKGYGNNS